jgi:predicted DNA-binding transcriptional regulator AlpA
VTPIPDIRRLGKGLLEFPQELNGLNRKPHVLDTVIRWADVATWRKWSAVEGAELWQVIALHLYLDPDALKWQRLLDIGDGQYLRVENVAALFSRRFRNACEHLLTGNLPSTSGPDIAPGHRFVRFADFADWATVYGKALPPDFPRGVGLSAAPAQVHRSLDQPIATKAQDPPTEAAGAPPAPARKPARQPRAPRAAAPEGYVRQAELLTLVPISAATLWRMVGAGTFPKTIKFSAGVTAWKREEVAAWLKERAAPEKGNGKRRALK